MRVAVYNRHWATAGGGERYAGAIAQALAGEHDVDLLAHGDVDWAGLEERLGLDLSGARPVVIEDAGYGTLAAASAGYDLLVTCSYMSADASGARHGLYVCLFPTGWDDELSPPKRLLGQIVRPLAARDGCRCEWGRGFHLPEAGRFGTYRWTSASSTLHVFAPEGAHVPIRLALGGRPEGIPGTAVEVEVDGAVAARATVDGRRRTVPVRFAIRGRGEEPVAITIRSDTFVPGETFGGSDVRELGVRLRALRVGSSLPSLVRERFPRLAVPPPPLDFLESYDRVVSISEFTRTWVRRLWQRESELLYPPVEPIPAAPVKEPLVLAVGRFFGEEAGHSKKQLELVRAFRRLCRGGVHGWTLHLVGGASPEHRAYVERVRREAEGLPVELHLDAPGHVLRDLYGRASVFWHATGLGEREERAPHRLEHFGISTVEAMSAGAVPVVIARAGQREIVRDEVDGLLFETLPELVEKTRRLVDDAALRERLAASAGRRAEDFGFEVFAQRLRELVAEVTGPGRQAGAHAP